MQKKLAALVAFLFMFFSYEDLYAISLVYNEIPETIVLNSPNHSSANWKEISKYLTEKEGVVEFIPLNQRSINWSELISIQYMNKCVLKKGAGDSIKTIMDLFRETALASSSGNKTVWKLIQMNKSDAIYEKIWPRSFDNIVPEHEVGRAFLTDSGLHRIAFTRKNREMNSEEKEQCIKFLRDSVFVVSLEEAKKTPKALSLLNRFKGSLNLGEAFKDWKEIQTDLIDTGYTVEIYVPPSFDGNYVDECLEITTMPNFYDALIDQWVEIDYKLIRKKSPRLTKISALNRRANEIVYTFTHPKDHLQVTGLVRAFLLNNGYYSISYKRGLSDKLKEEEILRWKENLEKIKLRETF